MEYASFIVQLLIGGLTIGSIYALIAVGFVITFNVTGVLNLSQGEFAMIGALTATSLIASGVSYPLTFLLAIVITMGVGGLFERVSIHPARNATPLTLIIITIGMSIVLRGIGLLIWGSNPHSMPPLDPGQPVQILQAFILRQSIWAVVICLIMVVLMYFFFYKTYWGKSLRAIVINRLAARVMGIKPTKMSFYTLSISAGLGALAGIITTPITGATYEMGLMLGLKAFVAAAIGGLTNAPAAVAGGFLIGIIESLSAGLISSGYKDAIIFGLLIIVLIFLPNGLFSKSSGKRV
ncbi:branched-chain amino acid ABC transporter permease [Bacillus sp. JJ1521]|uniref:branched-chain amino acid ABC transporter permease n=1 Tax=Bacillus sp. JJ1521 TaxID=3122957 RepID=UPI002FFF8C2B